MSNSSRPTLVVEHPEQLWQAGTRRNFLRMLGVGGTIALLPSVFAACGNDSTTGPGTSGSTTLDLSTDVGILNYAYALEQLEAGFYTAAVANGTVFNGLSAAEQELIADLRNHEVAHREFLRQVLGGSRIGDLAFNTTTIGDAISSREKLLMNAEVFEDLGVAAYNGAGKYLTSADLLTVAGKIVSVEARHAAAVRDARDTGDGTRFANADVVDQSGTYAGLDVKLEPGAVLTAVKNANVVTTTVTVGKQPASKTGTPDRAPTHS
jgi:hypothetical protein